MKSSSRVKPIAILVAVFLLGGVAGGALTWGIAVRDLRATMHRPPSEARAKFRLEAMKRHLDLTEEQAQKLEAVFEESWREHEQAVGKCKPALDELRARTSSQIDEILTPEQREKYAAMRERMRERFGKKHGKKPLPSASAP